MILIISLFYLHEYYYISISCDIIDFTITVLVYYTLLYYIL